MCYVCRERIPFEQVANLLDGSHSASKCGQKDIFRSGWYAGNSFVVVSDRNENDIDCYGCITGKIAT